ncbi:hypothetical protein B5P43_13105 [Bacillus sp. SRB_336]|nr:hypothetical protein B5P43_13105 [Bacillus sp. SRB_336]
MRDVCDMCDGMSWEQVRERNRKRIARYGFTTVLVEGSPGSPPFGYTMVGLTKSGHPELLVTGLDDGAAQAMLSLFATMVLSGRESFVPGLALLGDECSVYSLEVLHPEGVMIWAHEMYGRRLSAIQLVWTDDEGRFPWAPNADPELLQPLHGILPPSWGTG